MHTLLFACRGDIVNGESFLKSGVLEVIVIGNGINST